MALGVETRGLLLREYHGVLSTHPVDTPGYPFGSIVPYCLDRRGYPEILISRIAQHTKNIQADPKLSPVRYYNYRLPQDARIRLISVRARGFAIGSSLC